jgi:transcriptional regulator with XRE-family HTH domain
VLLNRHTLVVVRERSGMTKAELADRAGVDRTLITRIENGERRATPNVIMRLAKALDCSQLALCDSTSEVA